MQESTRVNFHCHTNFSDGSITPEALVEKMDAAGVRYAALTDHDTIEGVPRFQEALRRRAIGFISGVEISTYFNGQNLHLLGYGFDLNNPALRSVLVALRQSQKLDIHSVAGELRKSGTSFNWEAEAEAYLSPTHPGKIDISQAIALIHQAGGKTFLAHPFLYQLEPDEMETLIVNLIPLGLDGIEVFYQSYTQPEREQLLAIAQRHGLLASAGTDYHAPNSVEKSTPGIDIATEFWKQFRDAVIEKDDSVGGDPKPPVESLPSRLHTFRRRYFVLRILIPTLLAIVLFVAALWGVILPSFERSLLEYKREMIRELTDSAWSILASYERDERAGLITRDEAQAMAISRIEALRYGREGKDYFWLQDTFPHIIMHPYRKDLNGQDVSTFEDARGVRIFVAFADLVKRKGEGYLEYVWQWKDDPQRLAPKESFIKGFAPWGWIIGTGIYIEDVREEITQFEQSLVQTSLIISAVVILLLLFVVQQSLRIERERLDAESGLRESTDRYRALVEASSEGTLMVLDERCRYANPTLLQMLGYSMRQLEMLDLADLLPRGEGNETAWTHVEKLSLEAGASEGFEGALRRADGSSLECVMAVNPISFAGYQGFILLAKEVIPQIGGESAGEAQTQGIAQAALMAPLGLFQAKAARRGVFTALNPAAHALIRRLKTGTQEQPALADLFHDTAEFDEFFHLLIKEGVCDERILHLETVQAETFIISLTAKVVYDEQGHPDFVDGVIQEVTAARKREAEREALIEKMQTSLLFLHEPVGHLGRQVITCQLEQSVQSVAAQMSHQSVSAALVVSESGAAIGIVTDHDLRARVVAQGKDVQRVAVRSVMSAPLITISENTLIYEALLLMEEKGVQHLAVEDENGRIVSVVRNKELIQFQRYAPSVLSREIARAANAEEVAQSCKRTPAVVKVLLDSGAHPRSITHMISTITDAATERLIDLAIDELGKPPIPFAFIAMGSQGRMEQTLLTDQDHAIIFTTPAEGVTQAVTDYFLTLGNKVSQGLVQAGYPLCHGQVMASNPRWCRPLADWKTYFREWICQAEPQELLDFCISFDFRHVYGAVELAQELRSFIQAELTDQPEFFSHLAKNALDFSPPRRLFGRFYLGIGSPEHAGLNIKDCLMPIVSFARLYALHHGINQTHTLERLDALVEKNVILPASRDEITASYDFLMRLRLQRQTDALQSGHAPDNTIQPAKLGYIEEALLKQAFAQIGAVQKKISFDFLGGTSL